MRILYVLDSLGTGGAERSTADLWYFLREKKIEFSILVLGHRNEGIEREIIAQNFPVHFLKSVDIVSQTLEIARYIEMFRPAIVHSTLFKSNIRTRLARMKVKFNYIESLVNCSYEKIRLKDPNVGRLAFYFYKCIDRATTGLVDHFHAITHVVKDHYHQELNIPLQKITVIHRGRNENSFIEQRHELKREYHKQLGIRDNILLIVHVGRQEFQKGHLILLRAILRLTEDELAKCAFLFLGREGNSTSQIKSFLTEHPALSRLIWLGHRRDVHQILAAADVFVFPSLYEGLGGALIEAQASQVPVLCTDLPVLNEVVLKNENALMHSNETELAKNLSRMIEDRNLRTQMGSKSLAHFRHSFALSKINELTFEFYQKVAR